MDYSFEGTESVNELLHMPITDNMSPEFYRKVQNLNINFDFFLKSIDSEGQYQQRLQYILIIIIFSVAIQFYQIIYLFDPNVEECRTSQHKNILFSNPKFQSYIDLQNLSNDNCSIDCETVVINPVSEFSLKCQSGYLRSYIQLSYILMFLSGILVANKLNQVFPKRKSLLFTLFISAFTIFIYSFNFNTTPIDTQQQQLSTNLKSIDHTYYLYLFVAFYSLSAFTQAIAITIYIQFMKDNLQSYQIEEFKITILMTFSMSFLIGTLLKMIISNWRYYNLLVCGFPCLLSAILLLFLLKHSPKDLLEQFNKTSERESNFLYQLQDFSQFELDSKLSKFAYITPEQIKSQKELDIYNFYLLLKQLSEINGRIFFNHQQFKIIFERYQHCLFGIITQPTRISFKYLAATNCIALLYMGQLYKMYHIGQSLQFNMFCVALSEILGQVLITRFYSIINKPDLLRATLIMYGIVTFFIAMPQFDHHSGQNFEQVSDLITICIIRSSFPFTLELLSKKMDYSTPYMIAIFIGFALPLLIKLPLTEYFFVIGVYIFLITWFFKVKGNR